MRFGNTGGKHAQRPEAQSGSAPQDVSIQGKDLPKEEAGRPKGEGDPQEEGGEGAEPNKKIPQSGTVLLVNFCL